MKIRNGFVSNSSSSSFIIGLGLIKDINKLQEEIKKNNIHDRDILIRSFGDLKEKNPIWDLSISKNKIKLDSFLYSSVDININDIDNIDDLSLIAIVSVNNNEGDSYFMDDNDYDIDYDIDLNFFNKNQQSIFKIFNDESIIDKNHKDITFGAGRNG